MPLRFLSDGRRADLPLSHIHSQRFELTLSLTPPDTDTDAAASTGSDAAPSQPASQVVHTPDSKCAARRAYAHFRTFSGTMRNIVAQSPGLVYRIVAPGPHFGEGEGMGAGRWLAPKKKNDGPRIAT